jgi:hypothetical protein
MITDEGFDALVDEIMALGYGEETAADYAARIGDTPELAEDGRIVVRDDAGNEVARLKLKFFDQES